MSRYEVLTLLTSVLAILVAFVGLYRSSRTSARQVELQERQVQLERESARLAGIQAELLELGRVEPHIQTEVFQVSIHYDDGDLDETAIKITIANPSSVARSINRCVVGLALDPADTFPQVAVEAEFQNEVARYPIGLAPGASVILYSFDRRIRPLYEKHCAGSIDLRAVLLSVDIAGVEKPIVRTVGTYSAGEGLRS